MSVVWGPVSEWLMVIAIIAAALCLYKTLKSQKEVQLTQNEIIKIENIRFRESIKPELTYVAYNNKIKSADKSKKVLTIEVSNETDSIALEVSFTMPDEEQTKEVSIPLMDSATTRKYMVKGDIPLMLNFLLDSKLPVSGYLIFALKYQDIVGTKYKQNVFCLCDEGGVEIYPYLPEMVR
jgi:hypothetical protein